MQYGEHLNSMGITMELQIARPSPRPLSELEEEWIALFSTLRCAEASKTEIRLRLGNLAAPFLSAALTGYEPSGPGTVMLVGKATAGKNTLGDAAVGDGYTAETVKQRTPAVVEDLMSDKHNTHFWRFARKLSDAAAEKAGLQVIPFANLIWTNLAKIGVTEGNPTATLFRHQDALAVETILAEVGCYKPRLVVFTTGWYRSGCVGRILQQLVNASEGEGLSKEGYWSSPRRADAPAVLWTGHPQGKTREWSNATIVRAIDLLTV